jgi:hypothetical protein
MGAGQPDNRAQRVPSGEEKARQRRLAEFGEYDNPENRKENVKCLT